jgi:hypothetical protein
MNLSKKIIIHLLASLWFMTSLYCQSVWNPKEYHSISSEEKTAIFYDDFDDNRSKWGLGHEPKDWSEKIENSKLLFQSFDDNAKEDLIKVEFSQKLDFEIETYIRFVKGDENRFFGLQWGKSSDFNNQFDFLISGNGLFTIDKFSGEFHDYVPPTSSELLKKTLYNKLTIRKINNNYYFFINEELVHSMPFKTFFGDYIGFQVSNNSTINVDYLRISELKKTIQNNPPDIFVKDPVKINYAISIGKAYKTKEKELELRGRLSDDGGIYELIINGKEVPFKANGEFYTKIPLAVDINTIRIIARDQQLLTTEKIIYVEREVVLADEDPMKTLTDVEYNALIICVSEYQDDNIKDLDNPVNDGRTLEQILTKKYSFPKRNIHFLENPDREDMIVAFDELSKSLTNDDNLLIFFAGHGYWDASTNIGYWLPSDSKKSNTANWFRNSTIRDFIGAIKARHILLISDACFSGSIFKTRSGFEDANQGIQRIYSLASRKAMTSGTLNEVPDKSVFIEYFIKRLKENKESFLSSEQLFSLIKPAVLNNSQNIPKYGTIQNSGDEGGDFIFILK